MDSNTPFTDEPIHGLRFSRRGLVPATVARHDHEIAASYPDYYDLDAPLARLGDAPVAIELYRRRWDRPDSRVFPPFAAHFLLSGAEIVPIWCHDPSELLGLLQTLAPILTATVLADTLPKLRDLLRRFAPAIGPDSPLYEEKWW